MSENNHSNVLDDIEAELAVEVVEWDPEAAGEKVAGYVTAIDYKELRSGRVLPIVSLRTKEGSTVKVAAGRKVLARELQDRKVQVGDAIGLMYEGTRSSESGNEYHAYRVVVRPQGPRNPTAAFRADKEADLGLVADLAMPNGSAATLPSDDEFPGW